MQEIKQRYERRTLNQGGGEIGTLSTRLSTLILGKEEQRNPARKGKKQGKNERNGKNLLLGGS